MKLSISLLLPGLLGVAHAAYEPAGVHILSSSMPKISKNTPGLTPEETRLVLAQRLGVSKYHSLHLASDKALSYINKFGGGQTQLFAPGHAVYKPAQLVILAEGWTSDMDDVMLSSWKSFDPAFHMNSPPSESATKKFTRDLQAQISSGKHTESCSLEQAIDSFNSECWAYPNNVLYLDMSLNASKFFELKDTIREAVIYEDFDLILVTLPESTRNTKFVYKSYGLYDMPTTSSRSRRQIEEPMNEAQNVKKVKSLSVASQSRPLQSTTVSRLPICHISLEACKTATDHCSGHGSCYRKYGNDDGSCFACGCKKTVNGTSVTYWGGTACQKQDVSSQFWLLAGFSVVAVGIIGWAIGMMFSIGEEKLPGVIGAGVSGPKAR